jgi:hypothetical protein
MGTRASGAGAPGLWWVGASGFDAVGGEQQGRCLGDRVGDGEVVPRQLDEIGAERPRLGWAHAGAHARAARRGRHGAQPLAGDVGQRDRHVIPGRERG